MIIAKFYKETSEDWHPSFRVETDNHVESYPVVGVRYHDMSDRCVKKGDEFYRICISGADDTRMELDTRERSRADEVVASILAMETLTYEGLKALGFSFQ